LDYDGEIVMACFASAHSKCKLQLLTTYLHEK
jgi:hypothetical protein